jgi:uncharacterized protein YciI
MWRPTPLIIERGQSVGRIMSWACVFHICPLGRTGHTETVSEWIFFMHPPRDDFIATMTDRERAAFEAHAAWLRNLLVEGVLIVSGPCLGKVNTGVMIFDAPSEDEAQRMVAGEPVTSGGYMHGELRPYRLGLLRGRDE